MARTRLFSLLLLSACGSGKVVLDGGTEPGDEPADSGGPVTVSDLEARVHDTMASLVVLSWTQDGAASVYAEYSFEEGIWLSTPTWTLDAGPQRLLLLGAPFEATLRWRLRVDGAAVAEDDVIETGALPEGAPEPDEVVGDPELWDADARWFLGSIAPSGGRSRAWTFIVDRQGRVVWAVETPSSRTTFAPRPSVDGTEILIDHNSWWGAFDGGANSQVARYDIEGEERGAWDTPGLIHPFTQLGDGRIAWSAAQGGASYAGEVLAVLDDDGDAETLFDCNSFARSQGAAELCGANTLWWDEDTGDFLFSLYTLDTVIELDAAGQPLRWFGQLDGAWKFKDRDTTFWWQHGSQYLDNGDLLVSARRDERTEETVIREYALDAAKQTLTEVWSFGEGAGVYAEILGEPRRLAGGNTLHNYGSATRMREATPDGDVVWDLDWDDAGTLGCTWPLSDLYAFWTSSP